MKTLLLVSIVAALAVTYVQAQTTASLTLNADGSVTVTSSGKTITIPSSPIVSRVIAYIQNLMIGTTTTTAATSSGSTTTRAPRTHRGSHEHGIKFGHRG